jgi:uncharacterized protein (TIGR03382 family)
MVHRSGPVLAALVLASSTALAVVPRSGPQLDAQALTAMPGAHVAKPLRVQRMVRWGQATPPAAYTAFTTASGGTWQAAWDAATGVPSRIWGSGIPAPGAIVSAAMAEAHARRVLADHLALLAPGASVSDFMLVSNRFDGDQRVVAFFQNSGGRRVVGGQLSFRFKRDRLFVIASEALPDVMVVVPHVRLAPTTLRDRAALALRQELALPNAPVSALGDEVVVPLIADDAVLGYRIARSLEIDGGVDGRYLAYVDPASAGVIAVRQLNEYATGTVLYRGVDRYPGRGRIDQAAPLAHVMVNGAAQTTTAAGSVSWAPDVAVSLQTTLDGDLATVVNKAEGGTAATADLMIAPDGLTTWDATAVVEDDAQVTAYLDVHIAKDYVRTYLDPTMPTLDEQMTVNVNIAQTCNAFFDGKALNFLKASELTDTCKPLMSGTQKVYRCCDNTARVQDVGFHEYGHRVHTAEIIPGAGDFDGAMSEGAADFLAASITNDSGMGRGFYMDDTGHDIDQPLRELDPPDGSEYSWPKDIGEIHHTGLIFGGTFWDLRKALVAQYGPVQGVLITNKMYLGALRYAVNIPTTLIEALAADDDDGNLANGTPHECTIYAAFGRHGLRTATGNVVAPGTLEVNAQAIGIIINVTGLSERCAGDEVAGAALDWKPGVFGTLHSGTVDATPAGPNRFFAELPLADHETTQYKVRVRFEDNSVLVLADNLADPQYEIYQGRTIPLYCTNFEDGDPFAAGWTTGADGDPPSTWTWGTPTSGATDPHAAYSGTHILAQTLDGNYNPGQTTWVMSPEIDFHPYSDVRLQYRRWLAVEDSHYDQAVIFANEQNVWGNTTQDIGDSSSYHHLDKEWRFHDVPLSPYIYGKKVSVKWSLKSDDGLELGGWQLDDVCIVANPNSICGDGIKTFTEGCDDGPANADEAGKCRTDCHLPMCGDFILDDNEQCDEGKTGSSRCSSECKLLALDGGGCCSASGGGAGSSVLAGFVGVIVLRRRRRVCVR